MYKKPLSFLITCLQCSTLASTFWSQFYKQICTYIGLYNTWKGGHWGGGIRWVLASHDRELKEIIARDFRGLQMIFDGQIIQVPYQPVYMFNISKFSKVFIQILVNTALFDRNKLQQSDSRRFVRSQGSVSAPGIRIELPEFLILLAIEHLPAISVLGGHGLFLLEINIV